MTEVRSHNRQNELTAIDSDTLVYDESGNQTTDQAGKTIIWDAWNRVVEQRDGATVEQTYEYDGMNRRIVEGSESLYYTAGWQLIERRESGLVEAQYVWSPVYIDALLLRDRDTSGDGVPDERIYARQDANYFSNGNGW